MHTGLCKKVSAKFCDEYSVRAERLCIGYLRLVGSRKARDSNMQEFFCTTQHRKEEGAVGGWRRQIERRSVKSIKRGGRSENVIMSDGRLDCKLKITEYAHIGVD